MDQAMLVLIIMLLFLVSTIALRICRSHEIAGMQRHKPSLKVVKAVFVCLLRVFDSDGSCPDVCIANRIHLDTCYVNSTERIYPTVALLMALPGNRRVKWGASLSAFRIGNWDGWDLVEVR